MKGVRENSCHCFKHAESYPEGGYCRGCLIDAIADFNETRRQDLIEFMEDYRRRTRVSFESLHVPLDAARINQERQRNLQFRRAAG